MTGLPKTYDGHRLGEIIVKDHGICKIVDVDDYAGYTMETIMPKEVFVEAYKKYIEDEAVEPRIEYGTDGQPYELSMTNGKEYERPTEEITEEQAIDVLHHYGWLVVRSEHKAVERPKGEWTVTKLLHGEDVTCPFCNARPTKSEYGYYLRDNFCHECGADMRKGGAK